MSPHEASESQHNKDVCSDSRDETSQQSRSLSIHATTLYDVSNTIRSSENFNSDNMTTSTSLPSLPPRGQPFPFILPQPLGPISSPTRSSAQADISTRTPAPAPSSLIGRYGHSDFSTWGCRGVNLDQSRGIAMPRPTPAPTVSPTRSIGLGNMTGPGLLASHDGYPRRFENQHLPQRVANGWHTPATETHFPSRREEHVSVLDRPSAEGTVGDNSEVVQYHKCDECHEAFTTSSWLQQHKTTHFRRFRCGCGAAYIDKDLLLVSFYPSPAVSTEYTDVMGDRNIRRTRSASRGLLRGKGSILGLMMRL